jgi:hypothetical protein
MLITIHIADFKLANHYINPEAIFVSDFKLRVVKTKKGLASDNLTFTLHKDIFDTMNKSFAYSCYDTPVKIFIDDENIFDGYISKLSTEKTNRVKFEINSLSKWFLAVDATPKITTYCQNQLGSANCGIEPKEYKYSFTNVHIDGFTGLVTLSIDKVAEEITLGSSTSQATNIYDGNEELYDGNNIYTITTKVVNNPVFLELENWVNAIVIIDNEYKTNIVNVTKDAIYLVLNFTNTKLVAGTLDVYLKCDKTYGQCYKRFNNVSNFFGFANSREDISTIDIFSATNLVYCGQEEQEFLDCPFDNNLYGVEV